MSSGACGESSSDSGIIRRQVAASMKPAPSAMKYLRTSSFQCLREITTTPPSTLAAAAAVPSSRLQARGVRVIWSGARASGGARTIAPFDGPCTGWIIWFSLGMRRIFVWAMTFAATLSASRTGAQQATEPPPLPADPVLAEPLPDEGAAGPLDDVGPTPGAVTLGLPEAVRMALAGNFSLLTAAESVEAARLRYQASRAQFYPQLTPRYVRGEDEHTLTLDARQRLPWTGGSVTATS